MLLDQLADHTTLSDVVVCDHASCHCNRESLIAEEPYTEYTLLWLAPYSPMLNPIEGIWSIVKARITEHLQPPQQELLYEGHSGSLSLQESRMREMEQII